MLHRRRASLMALATTVACLSMISTASAFLPRWGGTGRPMPIFTEYLIIEIEIWQDGFVTTSCTHGSDFGSAVLGTSTLKKGSFNFATCTSPHFENATCTTKGAAAGEIKAKGLVGELGVISEKAEEVGLRLAGKKMFAKFQCGKETMELKGGLIAPITPINKLVMPEEHFTVNYQNLSGLGQAVTHFEGGPTTQLELSINKGAPVPVAVSFADVAKPSKPLEITTK